MAETFGFDVKLRFATASIFATLGTGPTVLHNVTEIHYKHKQGFSRAPLRIAFESDIHGTGITYYVDDIAEFEAKLATEKAEAY